MGLELYNKKRSFDKTPEPTGKTKAAKKQLLFVIQKHAASHLHYDFRLEMRGVLKSWAVPKGPSMNPADKRLAMMVEDHPFDYKDFEGIIPKGNYGAGTVIVWDQGTYEASELKSDDKKVQEKELMAALHKGHLHITLHGSKLKGEFVLVKSKNSEQENAWLLMKKTDKYVLKTDVTKKDKSVVSGKTIEQVAKTSTNEWKSNRKSKDIKEDKDRKETEGRNKENEDGNIDELIKQGKKSPMPSGIKPMLATLTKDVFDDDQWIYEVKWDGYRALAYCKGKKVEVKSRNNLSFDKKFYPVHDALVQLNANVLLDGEIIVLNEEGGADFQKLQSWQKTEEGELAYYAFDILWLNGYDLTSLPLINRKEILQLIIPADGNIRYSDHIEAQGTSFYKIALKQGLEGIMAKQSQSKYHIAKRSPEWLKIKTHQTQEAIICGYTEGRNSRQYFGSLMLGVYEGKELIYIGQTGSGFDEKKLADVFKKLQKLKTDTCPFAKKPKTQMPAVWVKPQLVCEVKFQEWTSDKVLRIPIFLGMREDKFAKDVKKEIAAKVDPLEIDKKYKDGKEEEDEKNKKVDKKDKIDTKKVSNKNETLPAWLDKKQNDQVVKLNRHELKLTNLDKIYWPEEKITKRMMLDYYHAVADYMLPYIANRPQSLNRHPNGITGENFYQKNVKGKVPEWIKTYDYTSEDGTGKEFLVAKDEASLIYIANLGCIEINPWHSRITSPEKPDWCVIDLDPDTNDFEEVIVAAQTVKQVLDSLDVPSYCKTSGSTGLHIYIPLGAKYSYEQSKQLAELIVTLVHDEIPDFTSIVRATGKRKGKIYLDFLQNRSIQTIAAPYSLRPKAGATVSTPLHWEEVKPGLKLSDFTIFNTLDRLKNEGDLFKPVLGKGIDMAKVLKKMGG